MQDGGCKMRCVIGTVSCPLDAEPLLKDLVANLVPNLARLDKVRDKVRDKVVFLTLENPERGSEAPPVSE